MPEENKLSSSAAPQTSEESASGKGGKSLEQEKFANLHPLRARLYDNVNLSLRTMDIIVAVVAIALLVVFAVGVATGSGVNLN